MTGPYNIITFPPPHRRLSGAPLSLSPPTTRPFLLSSISPVQHANGLCGSVGRALVSYYIHMTLPPGRDIQRSQVRALPGTLFNFCLRNACLLMTFRSLSALGYQSAQ
ncbi:hypothetical protein CGRA01v4_14867 [Colletotrichum graminicola]|nr:hypothetical protein CGRA01v4_14867 [Colletotrichum graminicola]